MQTIYMDHNATTRVDPRVLDAMLPFMSEQYGNPSSPYRLAQKARETVEAARATVARALSCSPASIVFTSGGSESDNIAVKGVAFANAARRRHIITTKTEHHAVLSACEYLEAHFGFDVTFLDVDRFGIVDPRSVEQAIRSDTALITIMHANNETGTIEPIEEIGRIARREGIVFHSDAVQTVGKIPIDTATLGVGLLSLSGHKMYGPKGVGALYVAEGIDLHPLTHGGGHEHGLRAGTENVAGIVGLATAVDLCAADLERSGERLGQLGARLEAGILERVPEAHVNGHPTLRLPGTVNVSFGRVEGESVVLGLDMEGVAVSTGSACTTGALEPSHVLLAMGVPPSLAQSSVRFSLGRWNTQREVDRVLEILPAVVDRLRVISPFRAHQR